MTRKAPRGSEKQFDQSVREAWAILENSETNPTRRQGNEAHSTSKKEQPQSAKIALEE